MAEFTIRQQKMSIFLFLVGILVFNCGLSTFSDIEKYYYRNYLIDEKNSFKNEITIEMNDINHKITSNYLKNYANLTGHGWRVREVKFSPTDSIIASGASDGSIRLWNLTDGSTIFNLYGHHYEVTALAFSPSGEVLVSGGPDTKIYLWNVSTGELINNFSFDPHGISDLEWLPDGKTIVVAGGEWQGVETGLNRADKRLQILNATTGVVIQSFIGHTDTVFSSSLTKNGSLLVSGSWDNTVRLWNVSTGEEIKSLIGHMDKVTAVKFSKNESLLISGGLDKTVKAWDVVSGDKTLDINLTESVWSLDVSPKDSTLAIAVDPDVYWPTRYWLTYGKMHECSVQLWNLSTGLQIGSLQGHNNTIESLSFSNDGSILASASWDWSIKLWGDHPDLIIENHIAEWEISTPEDQGINSTQLEVNLQYTGIVYDIHSILVVRHGKLVFERYYSDEYSQVYAAWNKHVQFSATKSFTSALIGIAIDKGYIEGVDQKVVDIFPEISHFQTDTRKMDITIHHLLTMTSGLVFDEYYDIWGLGITNDSVNYVLSKQLLTIPG
ncbi:MAG: WD40 domain-containing protein, partial [Candidatus Kariarchaeaceae archaeon]